MSTDLIPRSSTTLGTLDIARRALAEAETLPEIAALIGRAEVVRIAARKAKLGLDAINDWAVFKLDAERKAGELLADMDRARRGRPAEMRHDVAIVERPPTLHELGFKTPKERKQAERWQQVASLPETDYEAYKAETRAAKDVISTAGAVAKAKEYEKDRRRVDKATAAVAALAAAPEPAARPAAALLRRDPLAARPARRPPRVPPAPLLRVRAGGQLRRVPPGIAGTRPLVASRLAPPAAHAHRHVAQPPPLVVGMRAGQHLRDRQATAATVLRILRHHRRGRRHRSRHAGGSRRCGRR